MGLKEVFSPTKMGEIIACIYADGNDPVEKAGIV